MKKPIGLLLILFGLVDFPAPAPGSPAPQTSHAQASNKSELLIISGKVSNRGTALLCSADQKLYRIPNSETLRHLEGQYVTLKARFLPERGQLYVTAIRSGASPDDTPKLDDAAFRR